LPPERLAPALHRLFEPYQVDPYERTREEALSWGQIRELSQDPLVTIGAHTESHPILNRLPASLVRQEILESKRRIESQTGRAVEHFAYPYGTAAQAGEREFQIAGDCGFKTASAVRLQNIFPGHRECLTCLPRFPMSQAEMPNVRYLNLVLSGTLSCLANGFRKTPRVRRARQS
jgi:peptidoglycan/xylan/chitin deacetylase (PgdA/CDA1 family)